MWALIPLWRLVPLSLVQSTVDLTFAHIAYDWPDLSIRKVAGFWLPIARRGGAPLTPDGAAFLLVVRLPSRRSRPKSSHAIQYVTTAYDMFWIKAFF